MTKTSEFAVLKWGLSVGVILSLTLLLLPWRKVSPEAYQEYTINWALEFESYSHPRVYNSEEQVVVLAPGQNNRVMVIDKSSGKLLWEQNIGSTNTDVAPPVFEKGKLFLLSKKILNVWDLKSGDLLQRFDFESFDIYFNYNKTPTFWANQDSLILKTLDNTILQIGKDIHSLGKGPQTVSDTAAILWMQRIKPNELKDYALTNFQKLSPYWYNIKDSVYINWETFGEPLEVVSDSQLIIKTGDMILRKWDFKKDSIEWKQTIGNGVQAKYIYHKIDQHDFWLLWKHNKQVAFGLIDLQSGKIINHGVSSRAYAKTLQHQEAFSFSANYDKIYWVDWDKSADYAFKEYSIKEYKPITTTMGESAVYIVSEANTEGSLNTEPRTYKLKSFDRKNIE